MKEFSLTGFAALLAERSVHLLTANEYALEFAAVKVEAEAKRVLGTYDYGWPELAESTQRQRVAQGYPANEPGLRSGEMRDSIDHVVAESEAHIGSDDQNLVYFDLGTVKQPPRPVLEAAAMHKEAEIVNHIGRTMVAHLSSEALPKN
jgi:hypothetical protein